MIKMTPMKRTAIVTGGSSGIGFSIAQRLLQEEIGVMILGRHEASLREACKRLGEGSSWVQADVRRREDVQRAVEEVVHQNGRLDIVINNAGFLGEAVSTGVPLEDSERFWDDIIGVNLKGAFLMTAAAAPYLASPGGRIVNISSIGAFTGGSGPGSLAYAASKSGLHGLTYAAARELSVRGITVNAVAPGLITDTGFGHREDKLQQLIPNIPAGRPGTPDEVAAAVLYLISPDASYVTGEILNVNGGWLFGR